MKNADKKLWKHLINQFPSSHFKTLANNEKSDSKHNFPYYYWKKRMWTYESSNLIPKSKKKKKGHKSRVIKVNQAFYPSKNENHTTDYQVFGRLKSDNWLQIISEKLIVISNFTCALGVISKLILLLLFNSF